MAVSYCVYFNKDHQLKSDEIEKIINTFIADFSFCQPYDFSTETGYCPCRIDEIECGTEWEFDENEEQNKQEFDTIGLCSFRSQEPDELCSALIASAIAIHTRGVLEEPDGDQIPHLDIPAWLKARVTPPRKKTPRKAKEKKKKLGPEEQLLLWLKELEGTKIRLLVRSLPDDPLTVLVFDLNVNMRVMGRYWDIRTDKHYYSAADLPQYLSSAQIDELQDGICLLSSCIRDETVLEASFDKENLSVSFKFGKGIVHFYKGPAIPHMFIGAAWEMINERLTICPDSEKGEVEYL